MPDNVVANTGSDGATFAAASLSVSGDTAVVPMNALGVLSGSEGSWTYTLYVGGAGAVTAGTQRMTLASDDPAVVSLQLLDNAISGAGFNITQFGGASVPIGAGLEATAVRVTLPTDGTGVVKLGAGTAGIGKLTANSGVDIGDVDVTSIAAGDNNIGNVDIVTVPADPFGANADAGSATGSISAKLRFIASTGIPITGTVTVGSHAVTNAGTFVTQVDGAALTALQLIDNLVLAEDAVHSTGDPGLMAFAVRRDANTSLVDTDGDYAPMQVDATGSLKVAIISGAGSGGTALTDDAAFTAAATSFTPVGGIVTADSVDSGDGGAFAMLANRQQKVTLYDSGGTELAVGGGTQYTEDAAAAANPVGNAIMMVREDARAGSLTTADGDNVALRGNNKGEAYVKDTDAAALLTTIDADTGSIMTAVQLIDDAIFAEDVAAQAADKGIAILAVRRDADTTLVGTDNDYANLQVDANGYLKVEVFDGGGSHTVDNAGTFAVQVDGNALTALQLIDDPVFADDAAFTVGTSKVMVAGGVVDDDSTDAADEGDAVAFRATKERKQRVVAALDSEYMQSGNDQVAPKFAAIDAATSGDNTIVAAVASKKLRVLSAFLVSAGTVNVRFESGAGGTALTGQMNLVANSGFVLPFNPVGWFETAANTLLNIELSAAISVDGSITYIEVD